MRVTFQCAAEYWCTYTHEDNPWGWRKNYPRGGYTVLVLLLITTSQTGKFNDSFGTMLKLVRYWGQHSPSLNTVLILPKKIIKAKPKRIKLFCKKCDSISEMKLKNICRNSSKKEKFHNVCHANKFNAKNCCYAPAIRAWFS